MKTNFIDIDRIRAEAGRALRNHAFERMPDGSIYLPRAKAKLCGFFTHSVNGGDRCIDPNMVVNQGLNDILSVYFGNTAKRPNFYIAPFEDTVAIVDTLTAATFPGNQDEFTNYTEATRVQWVHPAASTAQEISNAASPARFTIDTGGGTIAGAGMLTVATKEATTGVLVAASLFADARVLLAGDKLDIEYVFGAVDA